MKEPGPVQKTLLGAFFLFLIVGNVFNGCSPSPPAKAEAQERGDLTPRSRLAATSYIGVKRAGSGWLVFDQYEGGIAFVPSSAGWDGVLRDK